MSTTQDLPEPLNQIVIEKQAGEYKDFGAGADYPLKGVTFAADYGYLPGYTGEDGAELDFFVGTAPDGLCGSFTVFRPELANGEHKFYVHMSEEELAKTLEEYEPVMIEREPLKDLAELLEAIEDHKATNSKIKAILFDADGVTIAPDELFAVRYARQNNLDAEAIQSFFKGDFYDATIGKADLKELLEKHRETWGWQGDVSELMQLWFEGENHPNTELVEITRTLRSQGIRCYLATNQEKYRTAYIRDVMFPNVFDGIFSSVELGVAKPAEEYYRLVLAELAKEGMQAEEVAYFDDSQTNITVATKLGIKGYLYTRVADVKRALGIDKHLHSTDLV